MLSHNFVPCEGGEHAIADQYLNAFMAIGRKKLNCGNTEKALEAFKKGQILPHSGAVNGLNLKDGFKILKPQENSEFNTKIEIMRQV